MFATRTLFHLKLLYCSWCAISFIQNVRDTHSYYIALCTSQQLVRIVHTFTTKFFHVSLRWIRKKYGFLLLWRNAKCFHYHYQKKSYHYQIYHCLKMKPSFSEKLFQKEKNKLLSWIYARRLSGHLFQWSAKIAGRRPQLKPLIEEILHLQCL